MTFFIYTHFCTDTPTGLKRHTEALCELYNDLDHWLWEIQAMYTPEENMLYLAECAYVIINM